MEENKIMTIKKCAFDRGRFCNKDCVAYAEKKTDVKNYCKRGKFYLEEGKK